ncbi:hypothetical protein [Mesobacillus foraminis]|nr:hypothetical protein [Mesobacillus foraminis]
MAFMIAFITRASMQKEIYDYNEWSFKWSLFFYLKIIYAYQYYKKVWT